jgi:hypothetical protein
MGGVYLDAIESGRQGVSRRLGILLNEWQGPPTF